MTSTKNYPLRSMLNPIYSAVANGMSDEGVTRYNFKIKLTYYFDRK